MAIYTCKSCGAVIKVEGNQNVVTCTYCNTTQTFMSAEDERAEAVYAQAMQSMNGARTMEQFQTVATQFETIKHYKDASNMAKACRERAEYIRKDSILDEAREKMSHQKLVSHLEAITLLESLSLWKGANELLTVCQKEVEKLRIEEDKRAVLAKEKAKRVKKTLIAAGAAAIVVLAVVLIWSLVIAPMNAYKEAEAYLAAGDREHAAMSFGKAIGYSDAKERSFALWDEDRGTGHDRRRICP